MSGRLSHSFGAEQVTPAERQQRIRQVFTGVAPRYDLMNDLMSGGIHRVWKRAMVRVAKPAPGEFILDLAGGTGDVAALMAGSDRKVMVCDPSLAMMHKGRQRRLAHVGWLAGEAEAIPLADGSVDLLTIAFGIRNVTHIEAALAEIVRVLKPGGRFVCLEFSRAARPIRPLYHLFSTTVIPRLGALVANEPAAYTYLIESIRRFPDQQEMKALIEAAGLVDVGYRNLSWGIACLHLGHKPA